MSTRPEERKIEIQPADRGTATATSAPASNGRATPLFDGGEGDRFRGRWEAIQVSFVDEPRRSVEEAERLVGEVMKRLLDSLADERAQFETRWKRGEEISTEELRQGLRRYRDFFGRLLSL